MRQHHKKSLISAAINLDATYIKNVASNCDPTSDNRLLFQEAFNIIYGYALLADDKFNTTEYQNVADQIKFKAIDIIGFLRHKLGFLQDETNVNFMEWAKIMSFADNTYNFEDAFFTSEKTMLKAGFRPIDMQLYIESERFNYTGVKDLLEKGANPNVWFPFDISENDLPLQENLLEHYETDSTSSHVLSYACDFFDCYGGMGVFKDILNNIAITNESSLKTNIMICGANMLLYRLIKPYDNE